MKLSIVMPVYNEAKTVADAIDRVLKVGYPVDVELVVVDDGSTDGTREILAGITDDRLTLHLHDRNQGKGAAVTTATNIATGDYFVICDADLEYSPEEIPSLLVPILDGRTQVVYGTRTFSSHTAFSFWYVLGNRAVTMFANMMFDCWISDLETCFKLMPLSLYRELAPTSNGFGIEAEVTGKILKRGLRPYEVPISYQARGREEGKKLTWRDGVEALWILTKLRYAKTV
jgi:glycosyltransferase involved in cell wall biosynthesis